MAPFAFNLLHWRNILIVSVNIARSVFNKLLSSIDSLIMKVSIGNLSLPCRRGLAHGVIRFST
jgi:hypothetical protein